MQLVGPAAVWLLAVVGSIVLAGASFVLLARVGQPDPPEPWEVRDCEVLCGHHPDSDVEDDTHKGDYIKRCSECGRILYRKNRREEAVEDHG